MARPYLTADSLTARVGGATVYLALTDDDADGTPDPGVEELLLGQVDLMADGYFRRGGYTVPLSNTDAAAVLSLLLDIANYRAKSRGDRDPSDDDRLLYENAIKALEGYADGSLNLPSGTGDASHSGIVIDSIDCNPPLMSRRTLGGY